MLGYHIGDLVKEDDIDHDLGFVVPEASKKWSKAVKLTKKTQVSPNSYIFTFKFDEDFKL